MRYIRYICIATFALALVCVALANRQLVQISMIPDFVQSEVQFAVVPEVRLPLFVIIIASIIVGIIVGFVWEWFREHSIRVEGSRNAREARKLARENKRLKAEKHEGKDEVLALLDEAS